MKRTITIELEGEEEADLELAQLAAFRKIEEGCREGGDRNESGSYSFTVVYED